MRSRPLLRPLAVTFLFLAASWPTAAHGVQYDLVVQEDVDPGMSFPESYFWDINENGLVCGTVTRLGTYSGLVSDLASIELFYGASWLRGINDADRVVGHDLVIDSHTGSQTVIPPVSSAYNTMWAQAINNNGIVVGVAAYRIAEDDRQLAFVWDAAGGTRAVPVPAAKELLRINNSNVAVGNIRPSSGSSEAFVYHVDTGEWIHLHELLNPTAPGYSIAADINDLGIVAGEGWNGSEYRAFTWGPTEGFTFLPNLGGGDFDRVHPTGINAAGAVVGYALTASEGWRGFIWDPVDGMRDLNDLIVDTGGFVVRRAIRINDQGMIVGDGQWGATGTSRAFLLTPSGATVGVTPGPGPGWSLLSHPNPFRGSIALDFQLPKAGHADLSIYDLAGRRVAKLIDRDLVAGSHVEVWTGRRDSGEFVPAGVYFAVLQAEGNRLTRKLVLTE